MNRFATLLLGLLFSGHAVASTDLFWCNGCTTAQKMGMAKINGAGASKTLFIGDITTKTLNKYLTYYVQDTPGTNPKCDPDAGHCGHWETSDQSSSVSSSELSIFNSLVNFYSTAPVGWKKFRYYQIVNPVNPSLAMVEEVSRSYGVSSISNGMIVAASGNPYEVVTNYPEPTINAFDVVYQGPQQNYLLGFAGTHYGSATFSEVMNDLAIFHVVDSSAVPTIEETYRFADGSLISVVMDYKTTAHKWSIKPHSAYDKYNNSIPQNQDEVASGPNGTREVFDYSKPGATGDLNRLLSQLRGMGLSVQGSGLIIACTRIGGAPVCQAYTNTP